MSERQCWAGNSDQLDQIDQFLVEQTDEETLDLFGIHGLLTAWAILPGLTEDEDRKGIPLDLILSEDCKAMNAPELTLLLAWLPQQAKLVQGQLDDEAGIQLPEELVEDESALENWSQGFMTAVYAREPEWFESSREKAVAELILPILAFSGLAEEECSDLFDPPELLPALLEQLPERLGELHLLINSQGRT